MSITKPFFELVEAHLDPDSVLTIYDIGSGDSNEAVEMADHFEKAHVYAFEANPACIFDCSKRLVNDSRLTLIPICVNNYSGLITFHPINQKKTVTPWEDGNPKASSIFVSNGTYDQETYIQDSLELPCMRIQDMITTFRLPPPDIVWMDLQGAELSAIKSIGPFIGFVKILHTEVWGKETYEGQSLFPELERHMRLNGFVCRHGEFPEDWVWADADFIKEELIK